MLQMQSSLEPLTEFAPGWQIPFWTTQYTNTKNIDIMRQWILDNERRIVEKYSSNATGDGGTGLGLQSLTAQYGSFNLFVEAQAVPEFADLFKFIRSEYEKFMIKCNTRIRECYMYSWANVVRTGQSITKHHHGAWHYSYLSGNMHFDDYNTTTIYHNPFDEIAWKLPNIKGGLTFFPSYIKHEVDVYTQDPDRVSMAFDLYDKSLMKNIDTNHIDF